MKLLRFLPRFRKAYRELETLAARERWSRQEIEAYQLDRINAVWSHAITYVPHYRELRSRSSLPPRFSSLGEFQAAVPVLPKAAVRDHPRAFLSEQPRRGRWRRTGGSTGTPLSVYWAHDAHLEALRSKYRFYDMWGLDIFERTAFLWGHSASFAPGLAGLVARFSQPLEDRLRNRIRLSAYRLGRDDLRAYLRRIAAFRPAVLYGYSRAFFLLTLEAEAMAFRCDSLKLFTLTGEPAVPHIVQTIEQWFDVPAVAEYGSIECNIIATEWPDRTLRVHEDRLLAETLPREDGRFAIVLTVLNNPSFPLIRFAIDDVTDAALERPAFGFAILQTVVGRNNDFIVSRSGQYLHSARFDALFKYNGTAIRRFRVLPSADGALSVWLELHDSAVSFDRVGLARKIEDLVEGYPVNVEIAEAIPQTPSGKHRLVVSEIRRSRSGSACPPAPGSIMENAWP
jgi:phenylacetate-CoA ligase